MGRGTVTGRASGETIRSLEPLSRIGPNSVRADFYDSLPVHPLDYFEIAVGLSSLVANGVVIASFASQKNL